MSQAFDKNQLINEIAEFLGSVVPEFCKDSHLDTSFSRLGLDSAQHVQLTSIVENNMNIEVEPTLAFDYPTINALINHLESNHA